MKILDTRGQDVTKGVVEACPPGRILQSRLPNVATAITLGNNTAYFVYLGCTTQVLLVKFVEFYVNSAGAGTQAAEVGLFTTVDPPNKTNQGTNGIVKLTASGTLDSLTTLGLKRNTTAFNSGNGYAVPAGTHLWAGIRTAMGSGQPALVGLCMDYSQGLVLSTASAGALTGAGPWTGAIIGLGSYPNTAIAPDLRVTLD
jgi:hypothetical protein